MPRALLSLADLQTRCIAVGWSDASETSRGPGLLSALPGCVTHTASPSHHTSLTWIESPACKHPYSWLRRAGIPTTSRLMESVQVLVLTM